MKKHFSGEIVCLELSNSVKYKEKKSLIEFVIKHGGQVSFVLNKKVTFLIKDDLNDLDTYKCRSASKLGVPILNAKYIQDLIGADQSTGQLKRSDYVISNKSEDILKKGLIPAKSRLSQFLYTYEPILYLILDF